MRLKSNKLFLTLVLFTFCVSQYKFAASYKTEIEITPAPVEETTTKKSGFFSGFKKFFGGSSDTTTTTTTTPAPRNVVPNVPAVNKPPPLAIPHAPLMPLGPRPDTPSSSPFAGNQQEPPQWPQMQTSTTVRTQQIPQMPQQNNRNAQLPPNAGQPVLPPGFAPYKPPKPLPSGLDLSYGGSGINAAGNQQNNRPGHGLAPLTSSTSTTTTTTTTQRPQQIKEDFPSLPTPRRPSTGAKEDFPALPTPKGSQTAPTRPSSPSAWSTPASPVPSGIPAFAPTVKGSTTPAGGATPTPAAPSGGSGVSFIAQSPSAGSTTTIRPGTQNTGKSLATDDEIQALTEILYTKEINSQLNQMQVNLQGKTRSIDSADEAPNPLLDVNERALEPLTIAKMHLLFNNYEVDTKVNEHVTPNERREENDFLDAVMATAVMRQAMQFLQSKGLVTPDPKTHRDLVKELWFTQYSRGGGRIGSSGFEHVFVHEVKNGTIIGLHNWVYFNEEEKAGRLDYKGYMKSLDLGTKGKVVKVRFTHNGLNKPVNTLFVGTSPELELALYTVCFELRQDRTCPVSLDNNKFGIVTYSWRYRGKNLIGSAYPEI